MNVTFEKLIAKITEKSALKAHLAMAVSGFGGSGKTTLANKLKVQFPDSTLVQLDNFLIDHGQGKGWAGGYDWKRLEGVLKDVKDGKDLHYQWYNWQKDALDERWIDEKLPKVIFVEGVRILQPELLPYFDLSIWIDCDIETATARGVARDRENWENKSDQKGLEKHLNTWNSVWVPKEKEFFQQFRPDRIADFTISNF